MSFLIWCAKVFLFPILLSSGIFVCLLSINYFSDVSPDEPEAKEADKELH